MDDVEEAGSRPLKHRGYQQVSELEVVGHNIIPSPLPSRKPRCNWDPIQHTKTDSRCCCMSIHILPCIFLTMLSTVFTTDVDLFESKYHPVKGTETRDCSIEIVLLNDGYYGPMIITREGHRAGKFLSKKDIGLCNAFDGSTHSLHCAVRWTEETDLLSAGKLFYGIVSWKARNCPTFPSLSGTVGGHQGIAVGGGGPAQVAEDGRVIKREPMSSINSYGAGHGPHGHGRM